MSKPPACDPTVYRDGVQVAVLAGPKAEAIEAWVKAVKVRSRQDVDWHFVGGYASILCIGDAGRVRNAVTQLLPSLQETYDTYCRTAYGQTYNLVFFWV